MKFLITPLIILTMAFSFSFAQEANPYLQKQHEILKNFQGSWRVIYNFTPPYSQSYGGKGNAQGMITLNDSHIEIVTELDYLGEGFIRKTIIGYDQTLGKYLMISIDQTGTTPIFAYGEYDSEKNSFLFEGEADNGENIQEYKVIVRFEREDKYFFEYFVNEANKWMKMMELAYIKMDEG